MMTKLSTITFLSVLFVPAISQAAIPNYWSEASLQGYNIYTLSNVKGQVLTLTCAEGTGAQDSKYIDNSVSLEKNGQTIDTDITFVIDDTPYLVPSDTGTTSGDSMAWDNFFYNLKNATNFVVYASNKEVGTFTVNAKNVAKTFNYETCNSKKNWEL